MTHYLLMAMTRRLEPCPWALHYAPAFAQIAPSSLPDALPDRPCKAFVVLSSARSIKGSLRTQPPASSKLERWAIYYLLVLSKNSVLEVLLPETQSCCTNVSDIASNFLREQCTQSIRYSDSSTWIKSCTWQLVGSASWPR